MPIQDSNAERRNLTVSSFFYVVFFLAEGAIKGSGLKLPMVNVEFKNTSMLIIILWVTLFWFLFRYWQTARGKVSDLFVETMGQLDPPKFVKNFILNNVEKNILTEKNNSLLCYFRKTNEGWVILFRAAPKINKDSDGSILGHDKDSSRPIMESFSQIKSPLFLTLPTLVLLSLRMFKYNSELVSYVMPYTLFSLALLLGLASCI